MATEILSFLLMVIAIAIPLITTTATGWWLYYQTNDMCLLGTSEIGVWLFISGLAIIVIIFVAICCLQEKLMAALALVLFQFFLIIISFSFIALTRGTISFGSFVKEINTTSTWMDIKPCLYKDHKVCAQFQHKFANDTQQIFITRHYTLTQSGCCKPPKECNFTFSSPSVWIIPENGTTYSNSDCYQWDNDPHKLCYNCQACKVGFARSLKKPYTVIGAVVLITWLLGAVLIFVSVQVSDKSSSLRDQLI